MNPKVDPDRAKIIKDVIHYIKLSHDQSLKLIYWKLIEAVIKGYKINVNKLDS